MKYWILTGTHVTTSPPGRRTELIFGAFDRPDVVFEKDAMRACGSSGFRGMKIHALDDAAQATVNAKLDALNNAQGGR